MTDFSAAPRFDLRDQHFRIPGPRKGMWLFLRFLPAENTTPRRALLYVHGATFPSALSIAHRFDGQSWRDALTAAGFDVKISRGTHLMHLEAMRLALWRESINFLEGNDTAPVPS